MTNFHGVSFSPRAWCKPTMLLLFLFSFLMADAQKKISGKITDVDNKEPVFGASVQVKGTAKGAMTDDKGVFTIDAAKGSTLVISSMEYDRLEIKVEDASSYNITLKRSVSGLNEVVVIGYGTVKRKDLTGAIASLKGADIKTEGVSNVGRALQGKLPGVTVESAGGDPGSGTRILIRGVGTFNNADPLYIVDGVQVANINNVAPGDIESMDVLKCVCCRYLWIKSCKWSCSGDHQIR